MIRIGGRGILLAAACVAVMAAPAGAAPEPPDDGRPPSLIVVPEGCEAPARTDVAFIGTVTAKDYRTVRYEIDQIRSGSASPWAIDGLIDIRYGSDAQYLDEGEQYLVGAAVDPEVGVLASTVRPPEPLFGGNDVIGLDDTAVECPEIDDPIRTLHVDGTSVDSGVLDPLIDARWTVFATIAIPTAIAFAALLAMGVLRIIGRWGMKGVFELGRAAVTPTPDHRAIRTRTHGTREKSGTR